MTTVQFDDGTSDEQPQTYASDTESKLVMCPEEAGKQIRLIGYGHAHTCIGHIYARVVILFKHTNFNPSPRQRIVVGVTQEIVNSPNQPLTIALNP
jgi:hypothetical protein